MPTVEFSPQYSNNIATFYESSYGSWSGIFGGASSSSNSGATFGAIGSQGRIIIFSGTIPAQPRLMAASDMANALCFWTTIYNGIAGGDTTTFTPSTTTTVTTSYKAAIATGTATWFSWCWYSATPPSTSGTIYSRIIGTVGATGSGADLEMPTTSIVTGQQYRVYNLRITIPSSYTY